jgi:predicted transcriptional regulator
MYERTTLSTVLAGIDPKRRALSDEHAAFEAFRTRLTDLAPFEPAVDRSPKAKTRRISTARIRTAYQETVMGVPHYQEWYNHTYVRSVTATLGPTLATMLVESSDVESPFLSELATAASNCIEQRDAMIDAIDRERANVQTIAAWLAEGRELLDQDEAPSSTEQPIDEHRTRLDRLARVDRKCERAIDRRRQHLRRCRTRDWPGAGESCRAVLYQHCETRYPVLAAITMLRTELQQRRKQLGAGVERGERGQPGITHGE